MMFLIIFVSGLLCAPITHSEAVFCQSDDQCPDGSYCENNGKPCVKCLSCEDFKRMPGPSANKCKKSILECGPCFDGLVAEQQQHCYKQSTPPKESEGIPAYAWAIIFGVLLVLLFLIVVVFIYLFRGNVLKISSRTFLRGSCPGGTDRELNIHASAPDLPPPYNPYTAVPSDSPPARIPSEGMHGYHYTDTTPGEDQEIAGPFVKRAPSSHWPYPPRESDDNQNAIAYNKPNYERHRSPIPDDADNISPIQDENTTESTWTPATNSNNINGNTSSNETGLEQAHTNGTGAGAVAGSNPAAGEPTSLSALVAAARDTTLLEPPAKRTKQHDSNNNGNAGAVVANANESNTNNTYTTPHQTAQAVFLNIQFNNYP